MILHINYNTCRYQFVHHAIKCKLDIDIVYVRGLLYAYINITIDVYHRKSFGLCIKYKVDILDTCDLLQLLNNMLLYIDDNAWST